MNFPPGSRSPKILQLYAEGKKPKEIAAEVKCSRPNVHRVLKRAGKGMPRVLRLTSVSRLSQEDERWLRAEARRLGVAMADLARAMLVDAIEEARDGRG